VVLTSVHPGQEPSESEDEALGFRDAVSKALRESDMVLGQFRVLLGYDGAARGILAVVGSRDIRCVKNHELLIGDSLRVREGRQRSRGEIRCDQYTTPCPAQGRCACESGGTVSTGHSALASSRLATVPSAGLPIPVFARVPNTSSSP